MLPKIDRPLFSLTIPSTKKTVLFRQFLVKEEKILLMAREGEDTTEILRAIKQVINNCATEDINIGSLTTFDIEYLFLRLRAKSVNNVAKLSFRDTEDDEVYTFEIDLDTIEVQYPETPIDRIKLSDKVGVVLKYPSANVGEKLAQYESFTDLMFYFIMNCIQEIYDEDTVYDVSMVSEEDLASFIEDMSIEAFEQFKGFLENMPKLYHKIEYKNKLDHDRVIELTSLKDFFTLG